MSTLGIAVIAAAAALPTWAGWIALTTWGLGWGLAGLLLGRHLARRDFDRLLDTARLLARATDNPATARSATLGDLDRLQRALAHIDTEDGPQPRLPDPGQVGDPYWPGFFSGRRDA